MATREKCLVLQELDRVMESLGWLRQDLFGMGSAYAKNQLVTPYYLPQVQGRAGRRYLVMEGYIGVIHRGFERTWLETAGPEPVDNGFCVRCLSANFRELTEARFIEPGLPLRQQVEAFGVAVAKLLESLPGDESALATAFETNVLYGKRLDFFFAGVANVEKFGEFRMFVGRRGGVGEGRTG